MKKIAMYVMLILFVMCFSTGCSDSIPEPAIMTFEGAHEFPDGDGGTVTIRKRFTINEELEFRATFLEVIGGDQDIREVLDVIGIAAGAVVAGVIRDTNAFWKDPEITGVARELRSFPAASVIQIAFDAAEAAGNPITVAIHLIYTMEANNISAVYVEFPYTGGDWDNMAQMLMGGFYTRVQ